MTHPMTSDRTTARHTVAGGSSRGLDTATHVSSLVLALIVSIVVGRPFGWIAFLLPLGPLFVAGVMRLTGAGVPRGIRSLVAFDVVAALLIGVGWLAMFGAGRSAVLVYVFPISLLSFAIGTVNYVMVTVSRTIRAAKGLVFDYPWIPDRLARLVGLRPGWTE